MTPAQADKLIWLSESATKEEYFEFWDKVQEEHGHTDDRMCELIGLRFAVNTAFGEDE
ncbi:hypothetical protein NIGALANA_233 [Bacillus phage Nigalana]|uniref:Uncharacterized protein n=1 Tax=Bacillus phage Megatron TaxID=1486661 RepID=A0A024B3N0_9CAUD|nr:hypothetical protein FP75_gp224 [Bacillus phage Megatron]YP_009282625.1 hypothetical protein BI005_gp233 [Bacillus phage Nigalana]ASR79144.1 hypothetical protein ZAINNY_235 [Bacillus phage Zainny]AXQ67393.1 hypothetical protein OMNIODEOPRIMUS_232 [Bacillus phage OmnioDeoPrimus]AHZ10806.1 hypothetical protein [Bacillus phage Megatron]AMW61381.1 hypothetical protein NIGALANA_233 [Bacillus phage Nigalana]